MIYERPRFLPGGDSAFFVELGDAIDPELNRRVRRLHLAIQESALPGVVEAVPAYRSLLVYYGPQRTDPEALRNGIEALLRKTESTDFPEPKVTEIPTCYGGEYGQDLEFVAENSGLSTGDVIRIHSSENYLIHMLGFMPGFAYLGGMPASIATPRLSTPRSSIAAGSVGIAGNQTGIYPAESPGGWRIIGRTPVELFRAENEPPALLRMGDYVRFVSIGADEFDRIREEVERGTYRVVETSLTGEG